MSVYLRLGILLALTILGKLSLTLLFITYADITSATNFNCKIHFLDKVFSQSY